MPVRITLSRKKGWRMPPNTLKVSRPGKWGNPFRIGHMPDVCPPSEHYRACSQADAVRLYREWLFSTDAGLEIMSRCKIELRGKNLACWCKPGTPCHADVLLRLANQPLSPAGPGAEADAA